MRADATFEAHSDNARVRRVYAVYRGLLDAHDRAALELRRMGEVTARAGLLDELAASHLRAVLFPPAAGGA